MVRGGYTPDEISKMSALDLLFINHYQELLETERQKFWTDTLGVIWEAEEFNKPQVVNNTNTGKPDRIFIPLSMAVNPEIITTIKENLGLTKDGKKARTFVGGGDYVPKDGEQITSMGDLSKDDFKKMMGVR